MSIESGFVTIRPHSNSNPSDDHLVVHSTDWTKYVNGAAPALAIAGRFKNSDDAKTLQNRLNAEAAAAK